MPDKTKLLFHPEELGWIVEFTKELQEKVLEKKWTALLWNFQQLGVALPADCRCDWVGDRRTWLHRNHGHYNTKVRAAIISMGAREGLYKAMYRALKGDPYGVELTDFTADDGDVYLRGGPMILRSYGEQLLDFLRVKPTQEWFRAPHNEGQLYQGSALENQERNPGLSN